MHASSPTTDVARLTEYARTHPRGYRARVAGLALLGYAYLFAAVALLAAVVAGLVFFILKNFGAYIILKLVIPAVVLIWMIGKSLWVRITPPPGIELRPGDAPRLMAEIEEVRTALRAPRVHHVLIDDHFNAGVSQYPRLGVFGGYRVYLIIGLPMLAGLPPEEFRAVLAHEFGHVSRAHGRFGTWILRVRNTWYRLLAELNDKNHPAQKLFTRFFRWYAPYFDTYTSVLSRAQEFEADEMSARIAPGAAGPSQCRIEVVSRFLDRGFWPGVYAATRTSATPPADVHHRMLRALPAAVAHPSAAEWLEEGLCQPTRAGDTHPSATERLAAMNARAELPPPFAVSAAHALLGDRADALAEELSTQWAEQVAEYWADQHRRLGEIAEKLAALESRAPALTREEHSERIWMTAELHGDRVAVPMARAFLDAEQEDASVHFLMGRALAEENDDGALVHLERAMSLDSEFTPPACSVAAALLHRRGRDDEAGAFHRRLQAYGEMMHEAQRERSIEALTPGDRFVPHGLDAEQLAAVREAVAVRGVKRAYVVRKRMRHFPDLPTYVIGLVPAAGLRSAASATRVAQQVLDRLSLSGTQMVITIEGNQRKYGNALRDVHAAEVFRAPSLLDRAVGRAGQTA
jgi:Zn-dependent protease with chaperone function